MPTYSIAGPDGKTYSIDGPEGATREQVIAKIKERQGAGSTPQQNNGPDYQQKPGFIEGAKRGFEQTGVGGAQLLSQMGVGKLPFTGGANLQDPTMKQGLAERAKQLEAQGKGTGIAGTLGEAAGSPLTYAGGIAGASKAGPLLSKVWTGVKAGALGGALQGALTPSTNKKEDITDRAVNTGVGAVGGGIVGGALPAVAAGGGKILQKMGMDISKAVPDSFSKAAKYFGLDFSKTKVPQDIATEVTNKTNDFWNKRTNLIWNVGPVKTATTKLGEIASSALDTFSKRKDAEAQMWTKAEAAGNSIAHDASGQVSDLKKVLEGVDQRIKEGEDTPDVKKARALVLRSLKELGSPISPEQQQFITEIEKGPVVKKTFSNNQFAPKKQKTTTTTKPSSVLRPGYFSETKAEPVVSGIKQVNKTKVQTVGPQKITKAVTKGAAPIPARPATAGDVVRAVRAGNEKVYTTADDKVATEVKGILNSGLKDAYKQNRQFARYHQSGIRATQRNADIYRDDKTAAKFGVDEKTLDTFISKLRQGPHRLLSTADLETINNGLNKIDTPEKLEFYKRVLPPQKFAMLLRMKHAAYGADIGTDLAKIQEARPMLEKIDELARIPAAKTKADLDNLEATAKGMEALGIKSRPEYEPDIGADTRKAKALIKAVGWGMAGHPVPAVSHAITAATPSSNASQIALEALKRRANPRQLPTPSPAASFYSGAGVSSILGDQTK